MLIERIRTEEDERRVKVRLTDKGLKLKDKFPKISEDVIQQFNMEREDSIAYYQILKTFAERNVYTENEENKSSDNDK